MPTGARTLENLLNGELARLLSTFDVPAEPELSESGRRMDVVADVDGLRVVLEAETGFHRKQQAIKDADARLKQGLTVVVFAVCYPEGASVDGLREAALAWTVRTRAGAPAGTWAEGGVSQLAQAVRQVPASLSGADKAAQILSDGLDSAVQRLSTSTRRALAQTLDLPADKNGGYFTAAKRGMLVVATAMLFHHRLRGHLPKRRPPGFDGPWPPADAAACNRADAPIHTYSEAWRGILAVDYQPVFETGLVALSALPSSPETADIVRGLGRVIEQVTELVIGLRHDLLGRIFHRVLDTARYDGSYYTSTAAAVLLATLALREGDADWSDPNAIANLRICDPACGTGTLLMAAAERIRDLRHAAGPTSQEDEEALALLLVEDVLHGYDINITATHMAASTLGMLSPTTQFHRMNIYRTRLGVYDGVAYLGSLEYLEGQARLEAWPTTAEQVGRDEQRVESAPPPMDLVIMNPPFTRDSLRHDQFKPAEEEAIKRREKEMFAGQPYQYAARLHSSGGAFTVLGDRLLQSEKSVLALVLPAVVPTAPGNLSLRRYLADRFHVDIIVSSHDPERIFFSENTSIGEVLIVCRRWNSKEPKPPTRVVNLTRNPATPVEALDVAARIDGGASGAVPFTVQRIPAERIAEGDWFAVNFLSPHLVEAYRSLTDGAVPFTTVPLSQIAEVGPEGRRIRDAYRPSDLPTASGRRALWRHQTDVTQSMLGETDGYIEPIPAKRGLADSYWEQRSRLLLPHRLWLPLARVGAVMLSEPAVGSMWTPCRPHDAAIAEALCLYLNSSIGLLALLGGRGNRKPSYPGFSIDALRAIPVPDFRALGSDARDFLATRFQWLQREALLPFPRMNDDPVRKQIDDAVIEALGLDAEWVGAIRRALSEEPSVRDRRYGQ